MLHGRLTRPIILFSLSAAAVGILRQLFNVAVVGQFVGRKAMAAVGSDSPLVALIVSLLEGMSLGANVAISTAVGAKKHKDVSKAVHTTIIFALIVGIVFSLVGELFAKKLIDMMNVPADVYKMALSYMRVYLAGLIVISLYNFEATIFTAGMCGLILLLAHQILSLFNGNAQFIRLGYLRLQIIFFAYCFSIFQKVFSGYLWGLGVSFIPAILSVIGICVTRIIWIMTYFPAHHSFMTILIVYPIGLGITGLAIVIAKLYR